MLASYISEPFASSYVCMEPYEGVIGWRIQKKARHFSFVLPSRATTGAKHLYWSQLSFLYLRVHNYFYKFGAREQLFDRQRVGWRERDDASSLT